MSYKLLDSGHQKKWEQLGKYRITRPCAQAVWNPSLTSWNTEATFTREPRNQWKAPTPLPVSWKITFNKFIFKIMPTEFGHIGLFPEHASLWTSLGPQIRPGMSILNLFAYTGVTTVMVLDKGAKICHVDASKLVVDWAKENLALNQLSHSPVRWIVDDVKKFLAREIRRGVKYDAIILDPPTFGRGIKGEVFKIETDLVPLLTLCFTLLSSNAQFVALSSHTPGFTPIVLHHLLFQQRKGRGGKIEYGELTVEGPMKLTAGSYAIWYA